MPTIYCLSGVSGVGKTYRRTTDPKLKDLPYVDIADIYREDPEITPAWALHSMITQSIGLAASKQDFVLEAYFKKGSRQRELVEWVAENNDYKVAYIELEADPEVCRQRIARQLEEDLASDPANAAQHRRYAEDRLRLLDLVHA